MTQPKQPTRLIHCYDVVQFVIDIAQAVKEGYSLDLKTPEHYPQQIGFQYIATMILDEPHEVVEVQQESSTEEIVVNPEDTVNTTENSQQDPEVQPVAEGTQEEVQAVVEAPKKPGRPSKGGK